MSLPENKREMIKLMLERGFDIKDLNRTLFAISRQDELDLWFLDNWRWLHQDFDLHIKKIPYGLVICFGDIVAYNIYTSDHVYSEMIKHYNAQENHNATT